MFFVLYLYDKTIVIGSFVIYKFRYSINSLPTSNSLLLVTFCLLMSSANCLNPDQAQQNVGSDPGSKLFDTDCIPELIF